jgi:hypothetical protein
MVTRLRERLVVCLAWCAVIAGAGAWTWMTLRGLTYAPRPFSDFIHFYWAAEAVRDGTPIPTSGVRGYIYPPPLAVLLVPLTWLESTVAARVWSVAMSLLTLVSAWLCARRCALILGQQRVLWIGACASLGFLLLADNFRVEAEWANCNNLIIVLLAGAFACLGRRPAKCGVLLGIAGALKYTPAIFLAYFLVRRRWREAAWMTCAMVVVLLAPALVIGWRANLEALANTGVGVAAMMKSRSTASDAPNFNPIHAEFSWSIPSGMARVAMDRHESATSWIVGGCALATCSMACVCWWAYRRHDLSFWWRDPRHDDEHRPWLGVAEFVVTLALMVAASPQTNKRHFNYLLAFTVLMVSIVIARRGAPKWWAVGALGALWLLAAPMPNVAALRPFIDATWKWIGGPGFGVVLAGALGMIAIIKGHTREEPLA